MVINLNAIPAGWYLFHLGYKTTCSGWELEQDVWECALQWRNGGGRLQTARAKTAAEAFELACLDALAAPISGRYSSSVDWTIVS